MMENVMKEYTKVWTVDYDDWSFGWQLYGIYTTEENAKKRVETLLKDEDHIYRPENFRIDWSYLDYEMGE
jgi:hypothetical protein